VRLLVLPDERLELHDLEDLLEDLLDDPDFILMPPPEIVLASPSPEAFVLLALLSVPSPSPNDSAMESTSDLRGCTLILSGFSLSFFFAFLLSLS
jgi:hypothetical protein